MAGTRSLKTLTLLAAALATSTVFAAPPAPVYIYGTGLDTNGDKIYRIQINSDNKSEVFATLSGGDPAATDTTSPNGIAVDKARGLIFYSVDHDAVPTTPDKLYSIPLNTGAVATPTLRGTVIEDANAPAEQEVANGAAMYEGDYYYLKNRTNKWYKAILDDDGNVVENVLACTAGDASGYELGDITGLQGVLYGSVRDLNAAETVLDTEFKFITLKLSTCVLNEYNQSIPRQMQLAWGVDYSLYGYDPADQLLYLIDKDTGARSAGPDYTTGTNSIGLVTMSDIDSLPPEARVTITKKTNGTDNEQDWEAVPEITVGETVTWTYEVANAGQLELTNVTVTDDKLANDSTDIKCDENNDGDFDDANETDNVIPTLAVDAETTCKAEGTAASGQYENIGKATADYTSLVGSGTVEDEDFDRYVGVVEESHDVALLVIDRDSIYDTSRCYKYKYGRCYKFFKDDPKDEEGDDDDDRKEPKYKKKYGPPAYLKAWSSDDLGSSDFGKRSVLPYFNTPSNFGTTVTLATGSVYKHSKYGSSEGWLAPDCIPQKWLSGAAENDNTCMTGDDRKQGIKNFLFNGFTSYAGAPSSTSIPGRRLQTVAQVLPLRARGLKLLEGTKVCAVVYDGDIEVSYKDKHGKKYDYENRDKDDKGSKYGQEYCAADNNVPGSQKSKKDDAPCIRGDLSGKTFGIVAFEVIEARDRDCKYCLPDVDVKVLDPAQTCNSLLLYNAPVPNGPKYPKDIAVDPLYDQVGYKKYRSLYYDNTQVPPELLF